MDKKPFLTVFMPVYNGSKFLDKSIQSVVNQSFSNWQLLCIDDSSQDDSFNILLRWQKLDSRIKVMKKPNGGSVPPSWNYAMKHILGSYVMYMSQDDRIDRMLFEKNYEVFILTGADIIVPKLVAVYSNNKRRVFSNFPKNKIISGSTAFYMSLNWRIHGFTWTRSEIMLSEPFPEDSFNSDEYVTRKNFFMSQIVAFSDGTFYYNRDNPNAITQKFRFITLTSLRTDSRLLRMMISNNMKIRYILYYYMKSWFRMFLLYYKWKSHGKFGENETREANAIFLGHFLFLLGRKN